MFKKFDNIGVTLTSNKRFMRSFKNLGELTFPEPPSDGYKPVNSKYIKWAEVPESETEQNHFF
jgi:hypothetical protein